MRRTEPPSAVVWADSLDVCPGSLRGHVSELSYPRNRLDFPEAMDRAESYVLDHWSQAGWKVCRQPYALTENLLFQARNLSPEQRRRLPRCSGANLIAFRPGRKPGKVLVVAAHLDTLSQTPGADDNTSGVAGLLELARLLPPLQKSVALVAFDMEEWNLLGSTFFATHPPWPIRGLVVYECIGFFSDIPKSQVLPPGLKFLFPGLWKKLTKNQFRGDFALVVYRSPAAKLARRLQSCFQSPIHLLRDPADLPLIGSTLAAQFPFLDHLTRSDHAPFWRTGVPAVMVTDTAEFRNANYHQPNDLPDTLDYGRMAAVVRATAALLADQAGVVNSDRQ